MGQPIAVRTDFTAIEVRRLARRAKDSDQVRRLLAFAAVLDGAAFEIVLAASCSEIACQLDRSDHRGATAARSGIVG